MNRFVRYLMIAVGSLTIMLFAIASIRPTISLLGYINEKGILVEKSAENAAKWYERAGDLGDKVAQYKLAMQYLEGVGVAQNPEQVDVLMMRSAQHGYPPAQFFLAMQHLQKDEISQDDGKKIVEWLRSSAKQGHIPAQRELAKLYLDGRFVDREPELAVSLLTDTGSQGDIPSLTLLADLYRQGIGVSADMNKAMKLEQRAAELHEQNRD